MRLAKWSLIKVIVRKANVVLEVLDSRNPIGTRSRKLEEMAFKYNKNLILVLNKIDLIPKRVALKWKEILTDANVRAVCFSALSKRGVEELKNVIRSSTDKRPLKVAVVGYPKVGKSSVINALKGRKSAPTSPIPGSPGYTRGIQLLKIEEGIYLLDTPGIIPIEGGLFESVIRGKSPEELKDPIPAAMLLLETAMKYNPKCVLDAYGISERDPFRILELIAIKRGWRYKKGGEPLVEEAARNVIRDYHKAKLSFYIPPEEALLVENIEK